MTKDLSMPSRSEFLANGILDNCPRCKRDAYKLRSQGSWHYWCDYCSVNHDKANESASFLTAGVDVMSDRFEVAVVGWDPAESPIHQQAIAAINTLKHLRYTWEGGEQWRPPAGLPPEYITGIDYKKLVEEVAYIVDGHLDYVEVLPNAIRTIMSKETAWWRLVPRTPGTGWVERYCELTNRNPDGEQTVLIGDGAFTSTYREVAMRELVAMLSAAPLGPQPYGWIECNKELPEPNKFVLVSNGTWVGQGLYNDSEYLDADERWQDEHHEFINLLHSKPVTHWMPLPEVPRKEHKHGK